MKEVKPKIKQKWKRPTAREREELKIEIGLLNKLSGEQNNLLAETMRELNEAYLELDKEQVENIYLEKRLKSSNNAIFIQFVCLVILAIIIFIK